MDTSTLKSLLWKDFRQNRLVLVVATGMMLLGGLYLVVLFLRTDHDGMRQASEKALQITAVLSAVLLAVLGGSIIATDRVDRSAAFLTYMPAARNTVVLSKVLCAAAAGGSILLLNIALVGWMWWLEHRDLLWLEQRGVLSYRGLEWMDYGHLIGSIAVVAGLALLVFGSAWLAGSFSGSPVIGSCIGTASAIMLWVAYINMQLANTDNMLSVFLLSAGVLMVGAGLLVGFLIGRWRGVLYVAASFVPLLVAVYLLVTSLSPEDWDVYARLLGSRYVMILPIVLVAILGLLMFVMVGGIACVLGRRGVVLRIGLALLAVLGVVCFFYYMIWYVHRQDLAAMVVGLLGLIFFVAGWLHELRRKADA